MPAPDFCVDHDRPNCRECREDKTMGDDFVIPFPLGSGGTHPCYEELAQVKRERDEALALAEARRAAVKLYYDDYMLDEADDVENCMCGMEQHQAARRVGEALALTGPNALEAVKREAAAKAFEEMRHQAVEVGKQSGLAARFCKLFAEECIERAAVAEEMRQLREALRVAEEALEKVERHSGTDTDTNACARYAHATARTALSAIRAAGGAA